jgi:type IV pilus assembly protein PilV
MPPLSHLKAQRGLSLIESLIALVIISVGLLGIAALQLNAVRQNSSAFWNTQAVVMAHNMADRIRANPVAVADYNGIDTNNDFEQDCTANACNADQMRLADATDWKRMLSTLPSGRGIVSNDIANQLDVTVMWDDEGTGATGTNCSNDPEVDLTCYTVTMRVQ